MVPIRVAIDEVFTSMVTFGQEDRFVLRPIVALIGGNDVADDVIGDVTDDVINDVTDESVSVDDEGYVARKRRCNDAEMKGARPDQAKINRPLAR